MTFAGATSVADHHYYSSYILPVWSELITLTAWWCYRLPFRVNRPHALSAFFRFGFAYLLSSFSSSSLIFLSTSLSHAGNSGHFTRVKHSSRKSSATHSYQCVQYFCVQLFEPVSIAPGFSVGRSTH